MRALMVLLVVAGVASVAFSGDEKGEKEKKKLAGTWMLASGKVDGKAVADEHVKRSKFTYDGEVLTLTTPHQSKEPIKSRLTRVDPSKKPAEMDWVRDAGPGAGKTMRAIYEWLDGDTYRICFDPSGKGRPKEFESQEGSGHILHVWKRSK
jgi:uncharacterized protein (TIGR03067 family)